MSIVLRPYQNSIIEQTRAFMTEGIRSVLIQSPTGSGKTALTAQMLKTAASKGMSSFFIVHRRELIRQSTETFSKVGIRHGIIANGFAEDPLPLVQIASVQTLAKRMKWLRKPKLIVWDECQHQAAGTWAKIYAEYPDAFHIGLSATPERLDGQGLGQYFKAMVNGPSVASLIRDGFLCPYRIFAPSNISLKGVHTAMGDFAKGELAKVVDKPTITGDAIKHYQRLANGKRAVVFCVSIEHSKHVVEQFNNAGIRAVHVDGETEMEIRDEAIRKFKAGEIEVLSNVELFGEGVDLPALEVAILLRPTNSLGLYLQQVGRALRTFDGKKEAIILDHASNCVRHGFPADDRIWSLQGRDKKKSKGEALQVRICKKCFAAMKSGVQACVYCGFVFEVQSREVEQVDGELTEVVANAEVYKQDTRNELFAAQTREQLVALAKRRGYRNPYGYAHLILQARQKKKLEQGGASDIIEHERSLAKAKNAELDKQKREKQKLYESFI